MDRIITEKIYQEIDAFLKENYEGIVSFKSSGIRFSSVPSFKPSAEILKYLGNIIDEEFVSFSSVLFKYIDQAGITDVEAYKRSNIDRRAFSKIKSGTTKNPSKDTVMSFAIGLNLNITDASDLMNSAGYSFSKSSKRDLIIKYIIEKGNFNIEQVNLILENYNERKLGE